MLGNWFKTGMLMAAIMALFGVVGALLGGGQGMLLALAFGAAMNLWAYWFSDTMVLKLYRAQEVDERSAPELHGMVRGLRTRGCRCRGCTSSTNRSRRSRPGGTPSMLPSPRPGASCSF
jgi:Zn-dependent protease with chaperone function